MKNNKGFTLVELLGTIVIIAIIAVIGLYAYTRYLDNAKTQAYDTLAKSAANAAGEYAMDHMESNSVSIEELVEGEYLENNFDPAAQSQVCGGRVDIQHYKNYDGIDTEEYDVTLCCSGYQYKYHFGKRETKEQITCE